MRIITNIHARYGRVSKLDATEPKLKFEPGFLYAEIPYISGIQNRKLSRYVHFYLMDKAILQARDLKPLARAFLRWIRWLEDNGLDPFTPGTLKYQSPTYGFREYLLGAVRQGRIASSTAA
ncbi:TPA: site-specific integrase, partial [Enterobacter cloacae]